jgi:hypothetical protein
MNRDDMGHETQGLSLRVKIHTLLTTRHIILWAYVMNLMTQRLLH